ncbi:hypothetical protein ACKKBG_A05560 [Auxenochlorella protothecoides x Auxenochlorella symbiontica]|uniref:Uncharacterized protein n=1 Tax=Auxenochlorella protothecoides TaxID=3075 RepID=A0A087SLR9_AUXPR|nr:hypothetical protein F751_6630 [Auxenochlorella protothecoides]KFM26673.1 hypothetical protein F751_6630 [Auxenochlorella protothecoides]RMZ54025.1 hypothetical protein APUTEX25_002602 [Auxenochlorella protothecoides]|eukprot:RMZ54025.1 hypothetical protein APUTEX25_002602 [Auxenochlorella protothecoides]
MAPKLQPLLVSQEARSASPSQRALAGLEVVILSGLLVSAFWWGLHEIKDHLRTSPNLVSLYPLLALGLIVTLLPPLMYLTLMDTFGVLHPLWPPHYIFIARQCLRTLRNNSLKVTAKEL